MAADTIREIQSQHDLLDMIETTAKGLAEQMSRQSQDHGRQLAQSFAKALYETRQLPERPPSATHLLDDSLDRFAQRSVNQERRAGRLQLVNQPNDHIDARHVREPLGSTLRVPATTKTAGDEGQNQLQPSKHAVGSGQQQVHERTNLKLRNEQLRIREQDVESTRTALELSRQGIDLEQTRQRVLEHRIDRLGQQEFVQLPRSNRPVGSSPRTIEPAGLLEHRRFGAEIAEGIPQQRSPLRRAGDMPGLLGESQQLESLRQEESRAQRDLHATSQQFEQAAAERAATMDQLLRGMEELLKIDDLVKRMSEQIQAAVERVQQRAALGSYPGS